MLIKMLMRFSIRKTEDIVLAKQVGNSHTKQITFGKLRKAKYLWNN